MPLDNIVGAYFTRQDPKDYAVVFIGPSGLHWKQDLTLSDAVKTRDAMPSGTAIIVRTASVIGKCYS